ncbi:MAG: hypothetical protein BMS9Abin37_3179 [Acidobacteriota bacterium]|nr:MAG: hypothetical protein BMS9Abin37_3179 [Acidobacteriota bacterium]
MSRCRSREAGEIRVRNLAELLFVFFLVYTIFQAAPAVITRINFLNELHVIANSPVEETALELRQKTLQAAEGRSIVIDADRVHVRRNLETKTTTIDVGYELYVNFFPRYTYVWRVNDHVEALLF